MKSRSIWIWMVTLITLGSGLINILATAKPALPSHRIWWQEVFPIELLHFSRFLTLLTGFALVVSSVNIYRRKKRAYQIVLALACLSAVFNFTKGHDHIAAFVSAILIVVLLLTRKSFIVKSSIPNLPRGILRFAIALFIGLGYGVAGFWFLEPREFGMNFTFGDAIHRTLLFFSLVGDPQIVPRTRHAHRFVDSLYLITMTSIGYSLFAIFRPVVYKFRTLPHERATAAEIVARHGRSSLDYFKSWPDKSYFFSTSKNSFLAYRVGVNFAVVLGDPVGPEEEIENLIRQFMAFCEENDWKVAFHQTLPDFLPIYKKLGFRKIKIGDDAVVDLTTFSLAGKERKEFRSTVNKLEKAGIHTVDYTPPIPEAVLDQMEKVSDEWLKIPGRRERQFTLGTFAPDYIRSTPVFVAADKDGKILAFVNIIPSYVKGEVTIDLMRRRTEARHGIMDYLFVKLLLYFRETGYTRFDFGMAPMSGFQEREEASPEERAIHYFFQHLNFLFSYTGLRAYKAKFASFWEPRYDACYSLLDLPRLAIALGQVTEIKN